MIFACRQCGRICFSPLESDERWKEFDPVRISTQDCQRVIQICEDIGFRSRWSQALLLPRFLGVVQVGAVTLFMPEDFSKQIFERLHPANIFAGVFGRKGEAPSLLQNSSCMAPLPSRSKETLSARPFRRAAHRDSQTSLDQNWNCALYGVQFGAEVGLC